MERQYYLSYKGKKIGEKMPLDKAEGLLIQMSSCFKNLQIIEAAAAADSDMQPALQASDLKRREQATGTYFNMA
jgi:hypothetical protein